MYQIYAMWFVVACEAYRSRAANSPKPSFHNESPGSARLGNAGLEDNVAFDRNPRPTRICVAGFIESE